MLRNVNLLPLCSEGPPFLNEFLENKIMMMVCRHLRMSSTGDIDFFSFSASCNCYFMKFAILLSNYVLYETLFQVARNHHFNLVP